MWVFPSPGSAAQIKAMKQITVKSKLELAQFVELGFVAMKMLKSWNSLV